MRGLENSWCWQNILCIIYHHQGTLCQARIHKSRSWLNSWQSVGKLPQQSLHCRLFLVLTFLMPWKLLCSHPLLLVSKNTLNLHMPRWGEPTAMPKRPNSCQIYSFNTSSRGCGTRGLKESVRRGGKGKSFGTKTPQLSFPKHWIFIWLFSVIMTGYFFPPIS